MDTYAYTISGLRPTLIDFGNERLIGVLRRASTFYGLVFLGLGGHNSEAREPIWDLAEKRMDRPRGEE